MTPSQREALERCEEADRSGELPNLHLRKTHEMTIWSLRWRQWIDGEFRITDAGRAALARDRDGRLF